VPCTRLDKPAVPPCGDTLNTYAAPCRAAYALNAPEVTPRMNGCVA
jgi:hypothetical protein